MFRGERSFPNNSAPPGPSSKRPASSSDSDLYCDYCDVWVRTSDQMQAHKNMPNHVKKYKPGYVKLIEQEEEIKKLKEEVKSLRAKVREYEDRHRKCTINHGNMEDYRKYKSYHDMKEQLLASISTIGNMRNKAEDRGKGKDEEGMK